MVEFNLVSEIVILDLNSLIGKVKISDTSDIRNLLIFKFLNNLNKSMVLVNESSIFAQKILVLALGVTKMLSNFANLASDVDVGL